MVINHWLYLIIMTLPYKKSNKNHSQAFSDNQSIPKELIVRINGVLPDKRRLGDEETSERYAEIVRSGMEANTSCSIIVRDTKNNTLDSDFHILFDLGDGVMGSIEKGLSDLGIKRHRTEKIPGQPTSRFSSKQGSPLLLSSGAS